MAATEKRTFTLPTEQSAFIDQLVSSGTYATASEVIRDGLRALQERNMAVERWLCGEVVPTYDRLKADPTRVLASEQVMQSIRDRQAARLKGQV